VLNAKTQVETGWRIYDPNTRTILDQFFIYRDLNCQGGSFLTIGAAQLGRKEAVIRAGNRTGEDYATRVMPYSIRVSRYYYVRVRKAYEVYRTPYALNFVNILQQRQSNDAVLRSQTELTSDR
jgi:hypothetical protein